MDAERYYRLKKLAKRSATFGAYIQEVASFPLWYGVPMWTKEHYRNLYDGIRGGLRYVDMFGRNAV